MATADNKVVTFKDLYGNNTQASFSDVQNDLLIQPFYRGRVIPNTPSENATYNGFSEDQYNKRLKYLYCGYALYGDSGSPSNIFTSLIDTIYTVIPQPYYVNANGRRTEFPIMFPIWHTENCTAYYSDDGSAMNDDIVDHVLGNITLDPVYITYSSIASMTDEDSVNDIWMEYRPIKKLDPSTGEHLRDDNGKLLYEVDENGNTLYEEGDYYAETRKASEDILSL